MEREGLPERLLHAGGLLEVRRDPDAGRDRRQQRGRTLRRARRARRVRGVALHRHGRGRRAAEGLAEVPRAHPQGTGPARAQQALLVRLQRVPGARRPKPLFALLGAEDSIGTSLTEAFQIVPEGFDERDRRAPSTGHVLHGARLIGGAVPIGPATLEGARTCASSRSTLAKHWAGLLAIGSSRNCGASRRQKCFDEGAARVLRDGARGAVARRDGGVRDDARGDGRGDRPTRASATSSRATSARRSAGRGSVPGASAHPREHRGEVPHAASRVRALGPHARRVQDVFDQPEIAERHERRLGLVEEGTFRKWMFNEDGTVRDTMWFSVVDDEWPAMKVRLEAMLAR